MKLSYQLDLPELVSEEVFVHLLQTDVRQNGREQRLVPVFHRVAVQQDAVAFTNFYGTGMPFRQEFMHGLCSMVVESARCWANHSRSGATPSFSEALASQFQRG